MGLPTSSMEGQAMSEKDESNQEFLRATQPNLDANMSFDEATYGVRYTAMTMRSAGASVWR